MKGSKGMQKRYYLFPILLIGVIGVSALESRRSGVVRIKGTSSDFSGSSNMAVATIDDIVLESPNSAFLPSENDVIEYVDIALNDTNESDVKPSLDDYFEEEEAPQIPVIKKTPSKKNKPEVAVKAKETPAPVITPRVASVSREAILKAAAQSKSSSRKSAKTKDNNLNPIDTFPSVRVNEGEEVLVSVSQNKTPVVYEDELKQPAIEKTPVVNTAKAEQKAIPSFVNKDDYFPLSEEEDDGNPFGVAVETVASKNNKFKKPVNSVEVVEKNPNSRKSDIMFGQANNPFVKAFSAIRPETTSEEETVSPASSKKKKEKVVASVSSKNLKKDLYHTYISDNQYLSPVEYYDDEDAFYEEAEEDEEQYAEDEDFADEKNVGDALAGDVGPVNVNKINEKFKNAKSSNNFSTGPLKVGNREVLQMKLEFEPGSSAISGESVNIIRSFAQIATDQPTNSIQIAISDKVMKDTVAKKLAARRLAIVSNVLRNAGISDRQISPVLTNRDVDSFSFRVVSNDKFDKLKVSKSYDPFGEEENVQEYNLMRW